MPLAHDDIEHIRRLIREELEAHPPQPQATVRYDLELRERTIRVEEELKHQRQLMEQGFRLMEKRLDQVDKRLDQVDKRFEVLTTRIDRFMVWSFGITLSVGGPVVAAIKYLP